MNLLLNLYDYLTGKKAMRFYCFDQLGNHVLSIMVFPANACCCYGKRHCSVKKQASRVESSSCHMYSVANSVWREKE